MGRKIRIDQGKGYQNYNVNESPDLSHIPIIFLVNRLIKIGAPDPPL